MNNALGFSPDRRENPVIADQVFLGSASWVAMTDWNEELDGLW
ncbi:hypothetical protein [Kaistella yonginensis]|nr:hypothetical protein [Kaistella yonginensis]